MTSDSRWVGSMPEAYDRYLVSAVFTPHAKHLAALTAEHQPAAVLELAAGTGAATAQLVQAIPDASVTATDLNDAMVSYGSTRVPDAQWQRADAQQLPFDDATFDAVVCQFGVMFFPDKAQAFAEAARVLTPSGRMIFAVWDRVELSHFPAALLAAVTDLVPGDASHFIARTPHGYHVLDEITGHVEDGGLRVESAERVVLRGQAQSARDLAYGWAYGSPLRFEMGPPDELDAMADRLADRMEHYLGAGPVEGDLAAIVVTASRPG
jgi:ubiquinone/menaquinone biosynthesis C-methylase UbiE